MPLYLSKFSYTPETWARLIRNPDDRRKAAQLYIESAGGKLTDSSMPLALMTATIYGKPQTTVALAISGGGGLSSFETTSPPVR
jgi:hypothetical protein